MAGNRILRKEGEIGRLYYDSRNLLKELLFYDRKEQGKQTYTYDAQENLLQTKIEGFREKESYQKRKNYQYNAFQQAIRVERTEGILRRNPEVFALGK